MDNQQTRSSEIEQASPQNEDSIHKQRIIKPLIVNQKYSNYFTLIPDQFVGDGIKQTNKYESSLTQEELKAKRQEFWDTRLEGQRDVWNALKVAIEQDETTAKAILQSQDLMVLNNSLQEVFDDRGWKYELPVFVINDPISFGKKESQILNFENQQITFKVRSTKWDSDIEVIYNLTDQVDLLIKQLQKENTEKIRLYINGKEMHGDNMFGNYGVEQDSIVQAFIF